MMIERITSTALRLAGLLLLVGIAWFVPKHIGLGQATPTQPKLWQDGELLTAADLNASFAALQKAVASQAATHAWSAFNDVQWPYVSSAADGHVARLVFDAPSAGYVLVQAQFAVNVRNTFDQAEPKDCNFETSIGTLPGVQGCGLGEACTSPGHLRTFLTAQLPTQGPNGGTYLTVPQALSNIVPIVAGTNTLYLNGRANDCVEVLYHDITMTAVMVMGGQDAALRVP